jgi:hypothetical protein
MIRPTRAVIMGLTAAVALISGCEPKEQRDPDSNCWVHPHPDWLSLGYQANHKLPRRCPVPVNEGGELVDYQVLVEGPIGATRELQTEFYNRVDQPVALRHAIFRAISAYRERADLWESYPAGTAGTAINPAYPIQDRAFNMPIRWSSSTSAWALVYLTYQRKYYAIIGPSSVREGDAFTVSVEGVPAGATFEWFVNGELQGGRTPDNSYTGYGGSAGTYSELQVRYI